MEPRAVRIGLRIFAFLVMAFLYAPLAVMSSVPNASTVCSTAAPSAWLLSGSVSLTSTLPTAEWPVVEPLAETPMQLEARTFIAVRRFFMADAQVPWGVDALAGAITEPAWRTKPSWYLVTTEDRMIPPLF